MRCNDVYTGSVQPFTMLRRSAGHPASAVLLNLLLLLVDFQPVDGRNFPWP